jgi:hypothetical protein
VCGGRGVKSTHGVFPDFPVYVGIFLAVHGVAGKHNVGKEMYAVFSYSAAAAALLFKLEHHPLSGFLISFFVSLTLLFKFKKSMNNYFILNLN